MFKFFFPFHVSLKSEIRRQSQSSRNRRVRWRRRQYFHIQSISNFAKQSKKNKTFDWFSVLLQRVSLRKTHHTSMRQHNWKRKATDNQWKCEEKSEFLSSCPVSHWIEMPFCYCCRNRNQHIEENHEEWPPFAAKIIRECGQRSLFRYLIILTRIKHCQEWRESSQLSRGMQQQRVCKRKWDKTGWMMIRDHWTYPYNVQIHQRRKNEIVWKAKKEILAFWDYESAIKIN